MKRLTDENEANPDSVGALSSVHSLIYGMESALFTLDVESIDVELDEQNRKHATGRAAAKINFVLQSGSCSCEKLTRLIDADGSAALGLNVLNIL